MIWIFTFIAIVIFLYAKVIKPHKYWEEKNIPHEKPWPIFGNMIRIVLRRTSFSEGLQDYCNKFVNARYCGFYQFMYPSLILKDPHLIKQIGIKDFEYFLDHRVFVDEDIDPIFGKNLFQLKGQKWRNMRSTLSPAFTSSKMKSMFILISDCADKFVDQILRETNGNKHTTIEMKDLLTRFANDVIATCAFGIECDSLSNRDNQFYIMGKRATDFNGIRGLKFFLNSISPFLIKLFKVRIIEQEVTNFFQDLIRSTMQLREEKRVYRPDLINLLMEAQKGKLRYEESVKNREDDTGFATVEESSVGRDNEALKRASELTYEDMTAQAMIFFLAGFDAISTLLCHIAYELALNPNIQEKLQAEIDDSNKLCENGKVTYDIIAKMKYLDMIVSETLRKWPTGVIVDRICTKTYKVEPVHPDEKLLTLNVGDHIWVPVYAIHRDPAYYPNPEKFDPERFSEENKHKIDPAAYIPFGVGPRNCIGSRFALLEAKVFIFYLLSKVQLVLCEKSQVPLMLSRSNVNLVAEKGFWLGLKPRNNKKS